MTNWHKYCEVHTNSKTRSAGNEVQITDTLDLRIDLRHRRDQPRLDGLISRRCDGQSPGYNGDFTGWKDDLHEKLALVQNGVQRGTVPRNPFLDYASPALANGVQLQVGILLVR